MKNFLESKVILITGSSRGTGAATAKLASNYGAKVVLHGKSESDGLKLLANQLGCSYIFCDVTDEHAVREGVKKIIKENTKINVLINCAGIANYSSFLETTSDEWLNIFKVNVLGTVNFCKAVMPFMFSNNYGKVVNVASVRGYNATAGKAAYSASKAAIINLTSTLAKEFAPSIAVNAVAPGFTNTDMARDWSEAFIKQAKTSLAGRLAEPEEIAEAILFLASDKASFMTGQTIIVDGGYSLARS